MGSRAGSDFKGVPAGVLHGRAALASRVSTESILQSRPDKVVEAEAARAYRAAVQPFRGTKRLATFKTPWLSWRLSEQRWCRCGAVGARHRARRSTRPWQHVAEVAF